MLARHGDCLSVLRDRRASSDSTNVDPNLMPEGFNDSKESPGAIDEFVASGEHDNRPFLFRDPPDHTRMRSLVSKAFTPKMVDGLRPRIHEIVTGLIDAALERRVIDVVSDLAYPLPVQIICDMLGIPVDDQAKFHDWSSVLARGIDPDFMLTEETRRARYDAVMSFAEYFFELLSERRRSPGDDLLSKLAQAEEEGDRLSEGEMLSTAILLLVAGHETTVNLIGGGLLALLDHPSELDRLRHDPDLMRPGVDEMLRYVSPVQFTGRTMLDDLDVDGATMRKGEFVILLIGSANRDPEAFKDPEEFILDRSDNRHLGFGFGIHHCLGAPLARLETQITITELVGRTRLIERVSETVSYKENVILRGLDELAVELAPA